MFIDRLTRRIWTKLLGEASWIQRFGDFRARERYGLISRPNYLYGMLRAADVARYFGKQRIIDCRDRHIFEIVGTVFVRGAVQVGCTDTLHGFDVSIANVFASSEHQVLKQVREARFAGLFVLRTDVVPEIHRDDWTRMILVQDHVEPVRERMLAVGDVHRTTVSGIVDLV